MQETNHLGLYHLWSAFAAWMIAQSIKFFTVLAVRHEADFRLFVSTGGMPSAHAALVTALATSVGLVCGFGSHLFAVTAALASIVLFDAQSVRRAAGQQARILNQIVKELFKEHHLSQQRLHELLGHTRLEVFMGMIVGIATALIINHRFR